jgi:hypothetical protein
MDRPHRIAQLYGYTVCLVAVITSLIAGSNVVQSAFDLSDPLHAERHGRDLPPSFEIYRAEYAQQQRGAEKAGGPVAVIPPDAELRAMYDAKRDDQLQTARHQARRSLAVNGVLLVVSIVLFATHWIWVRRVSAEPVVERTAEG